MEWVAVNEDGSECISENRPERNNGLWENMDYLNLGDTNLTIYCEVVLPKGTIKKLIGRDLTWSNDPIELKEE